MQLSQWAVVGFLGMSSLVSGEMVHAQTATQTVTFSVVSSSHAVMGTTVLPLMLRTSSTRRAVSSASVGASSYAIATSENNQKISASLNAPMPKGGSLAVSLAAPRGASSAGTTRLRETALDVVTGISAARSDALSLIYTVGDSYAVVESPRVRMVTFTVTAGL